jgi:NADPH:quinone reductase-like Zn-dependent oxidoreductase
MTSNIYSSNKAGNDKEDTILSARIHKYQNPLTIEKIAKPTITSGQEVLVKVAASGLCHSDLHLISGEWKDVLPIPLPITPGHEVAGWVEEIGDSVPEGILDRGDLVAQLYLVAGDVVFVFIARAVMSNYAIPQHGLVFLHLTGDFLKISSYHHIDFL